MERTGSRSTVELVPYSQAYGRFEDIRRRMPDSSRIFTCTGSRPRRTFDDILTDVTGNAEAIPVA